MAGDRVAANPDPDIPVRYELAGHDLLDLWKYEEDQGNIVKGRMLTIATWLLALASGVLGFIAKELITFDTEPRKAWIAVALSLLGLGICGYSRFMIREFGSHMRHHWESADFLRDKIKWLEEIKLRGKPEFKILASNDLPTICGRIFVVVNVFIVLFLIILSIAAVCLVRLRQ